MKKQGFTLAEVLITLGIIGVVAALTIPSLVSKYRKHVVETSLKKSYSVLSQILERSKADNGDAVNWDWSSYTAYQKDSSEQFFQKYFYSYINITGRAKSVQSPNLLDYKIYTSVDDTSGSPNWFYYNGNMADWVELPDGSVVLFNYQYTGRQNIYGNFTVILPSSKNKKKLIVGKDVFNFSLRNYGNNIVVSPYSWQDWTCKDIDDNKENYLRACKGEVTSGAGITSGNYCTSIIYCNGWKIPDDYPVRL